jgi:hypothetical protein
VLGKILKFLIALALFPLVAAELLTLYDFANVAMPKGDWFNSWHAAWPNLWVISLVAGFAAWLLIFFVLPKPMWLYVLGHEFTHALAAMLAGGKVSAFKVTSKGGHIMTDRVNWWIALSPYFVPIYALIWICLWLSINFYYPLTKWQPVLFFGIGLFWCFHLTFTISMFHFRQTDLTGQGIIFSFTIILLFNLLIFLLFFPLLTHDLKKSGQQFLQRTEQAYAFTGQEIKRGSDWALRTWHDKHQR